MTASIDLLRGALLERGMILARTALRDGLRTRLANVRCPIHGVEPEVVVTGDFAKGTLKASAGNVCCETLRALAGESMTLDDLVD